MLWWPLWSKIVVGDDIQFKLHQATSSDARPRHIPVYGCCELALLQGSVRVDIIPSLRITTIKFVRNTTDFQGQIYVMIIRLLLFSIVYLEEIRSIYQSVNRA
jgi:hypothetical protein